jgi:hypothetical protein
MPERGDTPRKQEQMAAPARPAADAGDAPGDQPIVYYFARDLFFGVRLAEGLARLHYPGRPITAATASELGTSAALAIVDLSAPDAQWQPVVEAAHAAGVPVLAFGSHLDQERWQLARALGATRIVANSQLIERFPELVGRLVSPKGPESP